MSLSSQNDDVYIGCPAIGLGVKSILSRSPTKGTLGGYHHEARLGAGIGYHVELAQVGAKHLVELAQDGC